MQANEMDLETLRKSAVILDYEIKDSNFKKLIDHVLTRIPDTHTQKFPSFSIYESPSKWGAYVDENGVYFDASELHVKSPKDNDIIIGTIAHELAHVFLKHGVIGLHGGVDGLRLEGEADGLASNWGFAKEVEAFRKKFGPATDLRKRK